MKRTILLGVVAVMLAAVPASANSISVVSTLAPETVDWITFSLDANDTVTLDVLARDTEIIAGNGVSTLLDTMIFLFEGSDPGNLGNAFVSLNDDFLGVDTNGSVSFLDSYLSLGLAAGDYTLVLGSYLLEEDEARRIVPQALPFHSGDYLVDILTSGSGNISNVSVNGVPVGAPIPEPATMTLLGLGLAGFAIRRRKQA